MADLNSLIAQGFQPQAPIDPFAQYAKMQQLNVGMNQNALAQYQLESAKRADAQANALNAAIQGNMNPDTGEINYPGVYKSLAGANAGSTIPNLQQQQFKTQQEKAALSKTLGEVAAQPVSLAKAKTDLVDAQLKQSKERLDQIDPNSPTAGQQLMAWHLSNHSSDVLGETLRANGATPEQTQGDIQAAIAKGPQGIKDFIERSKVGQTEFSKIIAPLPEKVSNNQTTFFIDKNPRSPTFMQKVGGEGIAMQPTPGELLTNAAAIEHNRIAAGQLGVSQGQLGVARSNLGLHAVTADPFNLTGAQTAFPLANFGGGVGIRVPANTLTPSTTVTAPAVNGLIPSTVTPPVAGAGRGGVPAAVATPVGTPPVSLSAAINQGLTGPDLLAAIPKAVAAQVTAITDHRAAPPQRNTTRGDQLMQLVNLVDPTYDATSYKTKQGIETAFTAGRPGTLLKSLNVVQDHLGTLTETAKDLGNSEIPFVNAVGNKIAQWTGQPAPSSFAAVKTVVADELTKAILGTAGALGDRNAMKEEINAASSPAALSGVINKWQKLIAGQVNGLSDQYKSGGGNNPEIIKLFGKARASATAGAGAPAARGVDTSNPLLQ